MRITSHLRCCAKPQIVAPDTTTPEEAEDRGHAHRDGNRWLVTSKLHFCMSKFSVDPLVITPDVRLLPKLWRRFLKIVFVLNRCWISDLQNSTNLAFTRRVTERVARMHSRKVEDCSSLAVAWHNYGFVDATGQIGKDRPAASSRQRQCLLKLHRHDLVATSCHVV